MNREDLLGSPVPPQAEHPALGHTRDGTVGAYRSGKGGTQVQTALVMGPQKGRLCPT